MRPSSRHSKRDRVHRDELDDEQRGVKKKGTILLYEIHCDISLPPRGSAATGPVRGQAGLLVLNKIRNRLFCYICGCACYITFFIPFACFYGPLAFQSLKKVTILKVIKKLQK
jgi:hypothetical protein